MSFNESKDQIQMNLALIPCEIFRVSSCVCERNPNGAVDESCWRFERDKMEECLCECIREIMGEIKRLRV